MNTLGSIGWLYILVAATSKGDINMTTATEAIIDETAVNMNQWEPSNKGAKIRFEELWEVLLIIIIKNLKLDDDFPEYPADKNRKL